jgi:pantoate--beta-alanine ligase
MQLRADRLRSEGKTIAFVPTMGFLHEGHLSLMREGRCRCDDLVVSIFVNPTQFGPGEDLGAYPRNLKRDLELVEQAGGDAVFTPSAEELYGKNNQTYVSLEKLPSHLCGLSRPTHFCGVATVVSKLFNIVKPHVAVFGEKDFQQLAVIRQMVEDMNFDVQIIGSPTLREADGLAMSSRNSYLTAAQRKSALCLYLSLQKAQEMVAAEIRDVKRIVEGISTFIRSFPETQIDYVAICDPATLDNVDMIQGPCLMALAVKVGKTRLIDNTILKP